MGGFAKLLGMDTAVAPTVVPASTNTTEKTAVDVAKERRLLLQRQALNDRNSLIIPGQSPANGLFIPNPNA